MNKKTLKIAGWALGLSMAVAGIGVAINTVVSSSQCSATVLYAASATSTLTFTSACGGSGTADDGTVWTVTSDASESAYDGTKGIHYGTGKAAVSYLRLSTDDILGTITRIVVNASGASSTAAKLNVTVGGNAFGSQQSLTSTATNYTLDGSASGDIVVTISQTSAQKAVYCKSIAVTYEAAAPVTLKSILAEETSAPAKHYAGDVINTSDLTILGEYSDESIPEITDGTGVYFDNEYTKNTYTLVEGDNAIPVYYKDAKNRTANTTLNINDVLPAKTIKEITGGVGLVSELKVGRTVSASAITLTADYVEGGSTTVMATSITSSDSSVISVSDNTATAVAAGSATLTATYSGAPEGKRSFSWDVTVVDPGDGTESKPYSPTEAVEAYDEAGGDVAGKYVYGIISELGDFSSQYHNYTFYISEDGTTENQYEIFRAKNVGNTDFNSVEDLSVGDKVKIYGTLTKYSSTYEMAQGCYLVSLEAPTITNVGVAMASKTYYTGSKLSASDFTVTVSYDTIDDLIPDDGFTWTVNGVANGALSEGENTVVVTYGGVESDEIVVTGTTVHATGIEIDETLSLYTGDEKSIDYIVEPDGYVDSISWAVTAASPAGCATVDSTGKVTAVAAGTATVTATVNGHTDTCTVTITELTMSLSWTTRGDIEFYKGDTFSLNDGAVLKAVYNDKSRGASGDVALTLESDGLSLVLKKDKVETEVPLNYEFAKEDNGSQIAIKYTDGSLTAKTTFSSLSVINWRTVIEEATTTATYNFENATGTNATGVNAAYVSASSTLAKASNVVSSSVTKEAASINKVSHNVLRIASSSSNGSLTFTFNSGVKITKVDFTFIGYSNDGNCTLTVKSGTDSKTATTDGSYGTSGKEATTESLSFDSAKANNVVVFSALKNKRVTLLDVKFYSEGESDISKSDDALNIEKFIDTYLHVEIPFNADPELDINNAGSCASEGWYTDAKKAYNGEEGDYLLTDRQRKLFAEEAEYANERARLTAWAAANGDALNGDNELAPKAVAFLAPFGGIVNDSALPIVITILSAGALAAGGLFLTRKRRSEEE